MQRGLRIAVAYLLTLTDVCSVPFRQRDVISPV